MIKKPEGIQFQARLSDAPLVKWLNAHRSHKKRHLLFKEFHNELGEVRKPTLMCVPCQEAHFI